jgi:hypothetical protein
MNMCFTSPTVCYFLNVELVLCSSKAIGLFLLLDLFPPSAPFILLNLLLSFSRLNFLLCGLFRGGRFLPLDLFQPLNFCLLLHLWSCLISPFCPVSPCCSVSSYCDLVPYHQSQPCISTIVATHRVLTFTWTQDIHLLAHNARRSAFANLNTHEILMITWVLCATHLI